MICYTRYGSEKFTSASKTSVIVLKSLNAIMFSCPIQLYCHPWNMSNLSQRHSVTSCQNQDFRIFRIILSECMSHLGFLLGVFAWVFLRISADFCGFLQVRRKTVSLCYRGPFQIGLTHFTNRCGFLTAFRAIFDIFFILCTKKGQKRSLYKYASADNWRRY